MGAALVLEDGHTDGYDEVKGRFSLVCQRA